MSIVEHISILDDLDVGARLDEFKALKHGWLDGKGKAPNPKYLDWLTHTFQANYPDELPPPYLYPTAEGGVQAEWSLTGDEITLDIDIDTHLVEWHSLDMATKAEESHTLDLEDSADWQWLVCEITERTRGDQWPPTAPARGWLYREDR